jgi:hypothetical protein
MRSNFARLIGLKGVVLVSGAIATYIFVGLSAAKSFAYGSLVALIGGLLLVWRHWQVNRCSDNSAEYALRLAYKAAIERFIFAAVMLALGFKYLELLPLWLMAGFVVGQTIWLFASVWMKLRTQHDD